MKKITSVLTAITVFSSALCASTGDQYIGVQNLGISYKIDFSEDTTLQGIIGKSFMQDGLLLEVSGIYKLPIERYVNGLGYISAMGLRSDGDDHTISFGAGAGVGVEVDIRAIDRDLPPVFLNAKGGLTVGLSSVFDVGIGVHYKF